MLSLDSLSHTQRQMELPFWRHKIRNINLLGFRQWIMN